MSVAFVQSQSFYSPSGPGKRGWSTKEIKHKLLSLYSVVPTMFRMASRSLSSAPLCGVSFLLLELLIIFWSSAENPFLSSSTHAQNYPSFPTSLSLPKQFSRAARTGSCLVHLCACVCVGGLFFPTSLCHDNLSWHLVPVFLSFLLLLFFTHLC